MAQDGPQMAPRWPKMAPRWPKMAPRWAQAGSRWPLEGKAPEQHRADTPNFPFWEDVPSEIAIFTARDEAKMAQDGPKMGPSRLKMTS